MSAQFFITGFGQFAGVDDNPTERLVKLLEDRLAGGAPDPAYHVLGTAVLECAGQSVRDCLRTLYETRLVSTTDAAAAPETPLIVLHMGVDVTGDHFKLEQQAINEASFRVPDQAGWQPHKQRIDDHPGLTITTRLLTDLDVTALADGLIQRRHEVRPSLDAGRYVCNFTYYLSLLQTQKQRQRRGCPIHALFLHVPPVAVVPLALQFDFLLDLLQAIAAQLATVAAGDGSSGAAATATTAPTLTVTIPVTAIAAAAGEGALVGNRFSGAAVAAGVGPALDPPVAVQLAAA